MTLLEDRVPAPVVEEERVTIVPGRTSADRAFRGLLACSAATVFILLVSIMVFLFFHGWWALSHFGLKFFTGTVWSAPGRARRGRTRSRFGGDRPGRGVRCSTGGHFDRPHDQRVRTASSEVVAHGSDRPSGYGSEHRVRVLGPRGIHELRPGTGKVARHLLQLRPDLPYQRARQAMKTRSSSAVSSSRS